MNFLENHHKTNTSNTLDPNNNDLGIFSTYNQLMEEGMQPVSSRLGALFMESVIQDCQ